MATTYSSIPTYGASNTVTIGSAGSGSIFVNSGAFGGTSYASSSSINTVTTALNSTEVKLTGKNPVLSTEQNKIDVDEMIGIIKIMKELFLIIPKNQTLLDSNPTLKDSYEQYESILKQKINDPMLLEAYNQYRTLEILTIEEK